MVKGLQFLRVLRSFPALGMHVIIPSKMVSGNLPSSKDSFNSLKIQCLSSCENTLKNSFEKPSGPGALLILLVFIQSSNSTRSICSSNLCLVSGDIVGKLLSK